MAYIPKHALAGLRNYRYKGVDKCVFKSIAWPIVEHPPKILTLKLCVEPVLDLVRHALARVGRPKHDHALGPVNHTTKFCDADLL